MHALIMLTHCTYKHTAVYCYYYYCWYREALIELESSRFLEQIDPAHINSKHGVTVAQAAAAAAAAKGSTSNNSSSFTSGTSSSSSSSSSALDVWYRFQHPLVQQALYNLTPLSDRRKVSLTNFRLEFANWCLFSICLSCL
jgi:predicted ATPase